MNLAENNGKKRFDLGDNDGKDMYNFDVNTGMMKDNLEVDNNNVDTNPNPGANPSVIVNKSSPIKSAEERPVQMPEGSTFEDNGSFCRLSSDGGILEIDLRANKQRGVESRYLSISVTGLNDSNEFGKAEMLLLSESQLRALQSFISKLNWND